MRIERQRIERVLVGVAAGMGALVFLVSLVHSMYAALAGQDPAAVVAFFAAGFPVLSGAAAVLLSFALRKAPAAPVAPVAPWAVVGAIAYLVVVVTTTAFVGFAPGS